MSKEKKYTNDLFGIKQVNRFNFDSVEQIPLLMSFIDEENMNAHFSSLTGAELEKKKQELIVMVGNTLKYIKKKNKKKLSKEQIILLKSSELSLFNPTA